MSAYYRHLDSTLQLALSMLNLANLRTLLSRVLDPPSLHTVALFTPEGELVCYASCPTKAKDHVRVLVGLSTEIWQETREQNIGMVDSEVRLQDRRVCPQYLRLVTSLGICSLCQWKPRRRTRMMNLSCCWL